ncbi:MAG: hypothetical protein U0R51_07600 [Solirubrobacterales bacterium]
MEAASADTHGKLSGRVPAPGPIVHRDEHPIDGVVRCAVCKRFPLVGEQVTRHEGHGDGEWACETCESSGRSARLGAATRSDRVRSIGGAANVHRAA